MRRNTALTRIMASGVAAIMLCAGGTFTVNAAEEEPVKADVSVKAIQGLSDDFIGGMDVSSMLSLEESGVTFKNANGEVEDLFTLLKESGVNYVRLRVWNDPFTADRPRIRRRQRQRRSRTDHGQASHGSRAESADRLPLLRFLGRPQQAAGAQGVEIL